MQRILAALVISMLCPAQEPLPTFELASAESARITFSISEGGIPLDGLLAIASAQGLRLDTADVDLSGRRVCLVGTVSVPKPLFARIIECLCYREGMLWKRGEAPGDPIKLVRDERTEWRVTPSETATVHPHANRPGIIESPDDAVFSPIEFTNMSAEQACIRLRPFLAEALEIGLLGDGKAVLIQGRRADVEHAYEMFRAIDVPDGAPPVVVTALEVKHIAPEAVARPLSWLLGEAASDPDPRIPREAPHVGAHPSRRALILCGTEAQVALARQIVALLDKPPK